MDIFCFQRDYRIELIPGYLILLQNRSFIYTLEFRVWDTKCLMEFMMQHYTRLGRPQPRPLLSESITLDASFFCHNFHLSAHASPLQEGHYTIWMLAEGSSTDLIHKYHISTAGPQQLSLHREGSRICTLPDDRFDEQSRVSYAGHVHVYTHDPRWICKVVSLAKHLARPSVKEAFIRAMRKRLGLRTVSKISTVPPDNSVTNRFHPLCRSQLRASLSYLMTLNSIVI